MKIKKRNLILIIIAVIFVISTIIIYNLIPSSKSIGTVAEMQEVPITYSNLASELSRYDLVWSVPEDSSLILKFYNFDSGKREFEKAYLIETGKISETNLDSTAEVVLLLHSKYLQGLTNLNFCGAIQWANEHGDLGFETSLSNAALAWKFKGMVKYKECFGF